MSYKKLLFFLLALAFSMTKAQNVKIKFYNKTGFDIDSLTVGSIYIGKIPKDSITELISFSKFSLDSGIPDEDFYGKNQNWKFKFEPHKLPSCGTELGSLEKGKEYQLDFINLHSQIYLIPPSKRF